MPMQENINCRCIMRAEVKIRTEDGRRFSELDEDDAFVAEGQICGEIMRASEEYYYAVSEEGDYLAEIMLEGPINTEETAYDMVEQLKQHFCESLKAAIPSGTIVSIEFPVEECRRDLALVPLRFDQLTGLTVYKGACKVFSKQQRCRLISAEPTTFE